MKTQYFRLISEFVQQLIFGEQKSRTPWVPTYALADYVTLCEVRDAAYIDMRERLRSADQHTYIVALLPYKHPQVKQSLWALKYNNTIESKRVCSFLVLDEIISHCTSTIYNDMTASSTILLSIPSSSFHKGERAWDQMDELCRLMSTAVEARGHYIYVPRAFTLTLSTASKSQHTMNKKDRLKAASLRLTLSSDIITADTLRGRHIIIIDDVTTTGATLTHARDLCLNAGARSVQCLSITH